MEKIKAKDRLILALDLPYQDAKALMLELDDLISIVKLNYNFFIDSLFDTVAKPFLSHLIQRKKKLFFDLKFDDISYTVESYIKAFSKHENVSFCTIHGNSMLMKAAASGKNGNSHLKILVVTVLTSLDKYDLQDIYGKDEEQSVEDLAVKRARKALELGCDGVITSGKEVSAIKEATGDKLIIVTPGIRLNNESFNDHKRVSTPEEAIEAGADYLVVGRPIYNASNRVEKTKIFIDRMQKAFDKRTGL